ncbi:hypothetical protein Leryth_013238 [Lithospermum erythrorhizon]|nr:hypothetical protein Leryth_013238 [Lithospermum erythrorhizon]
MLDTSANRFIIGWSAACKQNTALVTVAQSGYLGKTSSESSWNKTKTLDCLSIDLLKNTQESNSIPLTVSQSEVHARQIADSAYHKRKKVEKVTPKVEKVATRECGEIHFKNSRKGVVMHCKLCSGAGHNKKTFPLNQPDGGATEPLVNEQAGKNKKKGGTKRKAGTSMSQPIASNLGDGSSSTQPAHSQPPNTSRKSKKSM